MAEDKGKTDARMGDTDECWKRIRCSKCQQFMPLGIRSFSLGLLGLHQLREYVKETSGNYVVFISKLCRVTGQSFPVLPTDDGQRHLEFATVLHVENYWAKSSAQQR